MSKILDIIEHKKHYGGITLAERMQECHTPAISMAVIENYQIDTVYTHGMKRKRTKNNVDADTLFQAASLSKPVFAVAVMRLVERGKLDLDTDITEYLDDFTMPTYDNQKHKITLRQILSHYAGLNLDGFVGYQQGQKIPSVDQILTGSPPANSGRLKLVAEPGTAFSYSGGGYMLAQKIVANVCTGGLNDVMSDLVLSPFGMTRSAYLQPLPDGLREQIAVGYNFYNLQLPGGYNTMPELAAAGLWTTPSDLARFGIEMMKAVTGNSAFLKKNTAESMMTPAYEDSPTGLGFFIDKTQKGATFGHSGSNFGYNSNMRFCPDDGSGLVVMVNSDLGDMIPEEVTQAFRDVYDW